MGEESKASIEKAIEAISSLISLSHSFKSFNIKWQLIRTKLEELYSGLAAILISLKDTYDLATRCVNVSFSGKLLMQSDLDVMAGKFDQHTRNLSRIYSAGILIHGFAIVVSKPNVNACKDDMRFYIRDLLTRMKIGDLEMKKRALVKLNEAMEEDDRYVKIVVEITDFVNILVGFLDSEIGIQEESAKAVFFYLWICLLQAGGESCYNTNCPVGIIIVREDFPLGSPSIPVSIRGDKNYYATMGLIKDQQNGNWWLEYGGEAVEVGFWPSSRFHQSFGNVVEWGGEVYSASLPGPEIGYGYFPYLNIDYDAYAKHIYPYSMAISS